MLTRVEERKREVVDSLAGMVEQRLNASEAALAQKFLRRYFRDVPPEDLLEADAHDLYGTALSHLRFGQKREPGKALLRVYNPRIDQHGWQSTHTVIEIVNDDMPFLVDSVSMELSKQGLGLHLFIHPVIAVTRGEGGNIVDVAEGKGNGGGVPESFMHVEVDRQSDPDVLERIERRLRDVLDDVRDAVHDWREMRAKVQDALQGIEGAKSVLEPDRFEETKAFLNWLAEDNFTFLGFSRYEMEGTPDDPQLRRVKGSGLGILKGYDAGELSKSFSEMPQRARVRAASPGQPVTVAKATSRSTVHRNAYLDVITVKRYGEDGAVRGEHRFMGLFTSSAYSLSPRNVPLLRRKVERVLERSGYSLSGHTGKALAHLLETYPRDELFQINDDELLDITTRILHLQERQRLRLFVRTDPYERFVSCLVFVPRERYNTAVRQRLQAILEQALGAIESDFQVQLTEAAQARVLFTVRTPDGIPDDLDVEAIEEKLLDASTTWADKLREALIEAEGEEEGNRLFNRFGNAFPVGYQDRVPARAAVPDVAMIDRLERQGSGALGMSLHHRLEDPQGTLRFKLIRPEAPVHLSDALPIMESMGLRVLAEEPTEAEASDGGSFWIHDFGVTPAAGGVSAGTVDELRDKFQDTFEQVWSGRAENDRFNQLVLAAGLGNRDIAVLRAYCKYALQVGTTFSQPYIERTLAANPIVAKDLAALFRRRFDPKLKQDREAEAEAILARIEENLEHVAILDEDRILRLYLGMIDATLRTNVFQTDDDGRPKTHLSFKFDPERVPGMPLPKPAFEIFVYSPDVEGVHLRGGKVARGGLRWSDRREDFRTEVLGLVKAQMVKNSVIVPVGAKGGFFVKRPPAGADRKALQEEGIRCYKTFLRGLLDITDNRVMVEGGESKVVPPNDVVRYDEDDPYLVVAADKGTATFSDIANAVSREYGFWLDDAFASGGSAGYDHKGMGITARGAWESVKRHFREMGVDSQSDPFTVVGIGDMSGDVFGNGMLLSETIKLVAAFDHRHVFLDPDPDPAVSFAERKRLFGMGRSTWEDYDASLISEGGGVYPRTLKSIKISEQAMRAIGATKREFAPTELLSTILKAPVDLWWNGGIGTYVKASFESHADAQDRSNDALRVNGRDIRAKVVGEGGNLGLTQLARVEYALHGGRINTDFIDNSAGVDCSDHEVNIKILLGEVVAAGDMTMKQRDQLLAEMTDEVAHLVLRDNVLQNLALTVSRSRGTRILEPQIRFMRKLEAQNRLNREIEQLPTDEALRERAQNGLGMTRPETAVLLAYAKSTLYADLLNTDIPDREYFLQDLEGYFPQAIGERYPEWVAKHRLRRELVATIVANDVINRGLEVFISEREDETGAGLADIALAFVIARDAYGLSELQAAIEGVPREVPSDCQVAMLDTARQNLSSGTRWFLAHTSRPLSIRQAVGLYRPRIAVLFERMGEVLAPPHAAAVDKRRQALLKDGVEEALALRVAALPLALAACDVVTVHSTAHAGTDEGGSGKDEVDAERLLEVARTYFALDAALGLSWLRDRVRAASVGSRWDRLVLTNLEDDLAIVLRRLTEAALKDGLQERLTVEGRDPREAVEAWLEEQVRGLQRHRTMMNEIEGIEHPDTAMLSVAVGVAGRLLPANALSAAA